MTNPDYKALCAELVVIEDAMSGGSVQLSSQGQALDGYAALAAFRYIAAKARIALAQPEPVPTDEELLELMPQQFRDDLATVSRLAAHGTNPDVTPGIFRVTLNTGALDYARAALACWGTPANKPVPVSERLPGAEDCDKQERCWVFDDMLGLPSWTLIKVLGKNLEPDMAWLPHHALPVPAHVNPTREEN